MPLVDRDTTWQQVALFVVVLAFLFGGLMVFTYYSTAADSRSANLADGMMVGWCLLGAAPPIGLMLYRSHCRARMQRTSPVLLSPWILVALGALLALGGIVASSIGHFWAAHAGGGKYTIWIGMIVFGIIQIARGLTEVLNGPKAQPKASATVRRSRQSKNGLVRRAGQ